jgi:hypothetical protein
MLQPSSHGESRSNALTSNKERNSWPVRKLKKELRTDLRRLQLQVRRMLHKAHLAQRPTQLNHKALPSFDPRRLTPHLHLADRLHPSRALSHLNNLNSRRGPFNLAHQRKPLLRNLRHPQ